VPWWAWLIIGVALGAALLVIIGWAYVLGSNLRSQWFG
jgi:hypothetical protein